MTKKSPVTHLRDVCTKLKHPSPLYEELDAEQSANQHPRLFKVKVTVRELSAEGLGTSKKKARHAAAFKLLIEMKDLTYVYADMAWESELESIQQASVVAGTNPIGDLDRLTSKLFLAPPIYESSVEYEGVGPARDKHKHRQQRKHMCRVTVNNHTLTGESRLSKKEAKRNAAELMLSLLNSAHVTRHEESDNGPRDHTNSAECEPITETGTTTQCSDSESGTASHLLTTPSGCKLPCNWSDLVRRAELYSQIYCCRKVSASGDEMIKVLCSVVSDVQFFDISEPTINGLYQCLVRLSACPVVVLHGAGDSPDDARRSAAARALEYLRAVLNTSSSSCDHQLQ